MQRHLNACSFISIACNALAVLSLNVTVPVFAPSSALGIPGSYISLSIEQDRWTDWIGTTQQNTFFVNTLENLRKLSGELPHIRIGANSEDRTDWDPNVQFTEAVFPAPSTTVPYPEISHMVVGDGYYQTAKFLPPGSHVTWGVNFGTNNITAAYLETLSILRAFNSPSITSRGITLDYLEIGNEPDLYKNNGLRASNYDVGTCTREWIQFAKNVSAASGMTTGKTNAKFLIGSLAGSSHTTSGFSPQGFFANGILESDPGKYIGAFSEHRYSGSFCTGNGGLLSDLMTKSTIRGNLTVFNDDIALVHSKNLPYIMGETNSYACHGAPGVSNTAGAALWGLDYALFSRAGTQMEQLFFHVGVGFKYTLLQPVTLTRSILDGSPLPAPVPPHIQPLYYAAVITAEAISGSGTKIIELSIDSPNVSGYAFYQGNVVKRIVLINGKTYLRENQSRARTSVHIDFAFASTTSKGKTVPATMKVKRLAIAFADDTSGVTWGGQTYETADGKVSGQLDVKTVNVADGVDVAETEVVMLSF